MWPQLLTISSRRLTSHTYRSQSISLGGGDTKMKERVAALGELPGFEWGQPHLHAWVPRV